MNLTADELQSARWVQAGPRYWILKCTFSRGSAVLATIVQSGVYRWIAGDAHGGSAATLLAAQRQARAALRSLL